MQAEDHKVLKTVGMARKRRRAQGCGSCPGCLREDCGQCRNCKDKVKFGGPGTKKQKCMLRACTNMVSICPFLHASAYYNCTTSMHVGIEKYFWCLPKSYSSYHPSPKWLQSKFQLIICVLPLNNLRSIFVGS